MVKALCLGHQELYLELFQTSAPTSLLSLVHFWNPRKQEQVGMRRGRLQYSFCEECSNRFLVLPSSRPHSRKLCFTLGSLCLGVTYEGVLERAWKDGTLLREESQGWSLERVMVRLHRGVPRLAVAPGDALHAPVLGVLWLLRCSNFLGFWLALLELQAYTHDHRSTEKSLVMAKFMSSSCLPTHIVIRPYPLARCVCLSSVSSVLVELNCSSVYFLPGFPWLDALFTCPLSSLQEVF